MLRFPNTRRRAGPVFSLRIGLCAGGKAAPLPSAIIDARTEGTRRIADNIDLAVFECVQLLIEPHRVT
jgi:hypothetical protein